MTLRIEPLSPAIGATVSGIDLAAPVDEPTAAALRRAWRDHGLLLFRDQDLSVPQQLAAGRVFGELDRRAQVKTLALEDDARYDPYVTMITNIREDGRPIGSLPDGELWFHADKCFMADPFKALLLYALRVPAHGGTTKFANQYLAYDRLPDALRRRIAGLKVLQVYDFKLGPQDFKPDYRAGLTPTALSHVHPIVITNPDTGRRSLFVNRLMTAYIEGLPPAEADALLDELLARSEDPEITYEHHWRPGDLIVWDNRSTLHARTDFPPDEVRLMRRVTVKGQPIAA